MLEQEDVMKDISGKALLVASAALIVAMGIRFAAASPVEGDYCPNRMKPVFVCDPLQQCWYECRGANGAVDPTTRTSVDPDRPGTDPETPSNVGNPGNAKNVGRAGEKDMDNESPRSGTKGRKGEKGGKK
jgi:hypothetical protein